MQIAWSSDSRMFVSGSKDSTLKVGGGMEDGGTRERRTNLGCTRKLKVDLPGHADEVFTVD